MTVHDMLARCGIVLDKDGKSVAEKEGLYYVAQYLEESERVHIFTALGMLPESPSVEVTKLLLEANLPAPSGGPGTCAYLRASNYVIYHMSIDMTNTDFTKIEENINDFRDAALEIATKLYEITDTTSGSDTSSFDTRNYIPPDMMLFC